MHVRGTDFVMFSVSDIAGSVKFYRDVLGLHCDIESVADKWAEFDCGNVTLSLNGSQASGETRAGGRIALAVDSVYDAYEELTKRGIKLDGAPVDYGVCVALEVRDPDGNTVILHKRADGSFGHNAVLPARSD
jgi:catechol 2,3-dioxygenase-like lactoylglutathione lyase family enzyme